MGTLVEPMAHAVTAYPLFWLGLFCLIGFCVEEVCRAYTNGKQSDADMVQFQRDFQRDHAEYKRLFDEEHPKN